MAKLVRYEFTGNWIWFWFYCVSVIGIPLGLLYLINGTLRIEQDVEDPEVLVAALRGRS